ncbi:MAG: hypothetical protein JSR95_04770 [Proteobacteria bacterium]|nr:hypothetical protein [Pseudomonadota bacterium]
MLNKLVLRRDRPATVKRRSGMRLAIFMFGAAGLSVLRVDAATTHPSRVGVVSLLGDTFHAEHIGLTAFNQHSYDVEVPEWQIDRDMTGCLVAKLVSANLSSGSVNIRAKWPLLIR